MTWVCRLFLAWFLALTLQGAPDLRVAAVVRKGLPPYEDTERLYRIEGPDAPTLHPGEVLTLGRAGERRALGWLKVVSVAGDHALAVQAAPGATFPMKGDRVLRAERLPPLPGRMTWREPVPTPDALAPRSLASPREGPPVGRVVPKPPLLHREPIYFLKASAALSPGAFVKLQTWVESWGRGGHWILECPGDPGTLLAQERTAALAAELTRLGVERLDVTGGHEWPSGPYDAVYVKVESW